MFHYGTLLTNLNRLSVNLLEKHLTLSQVSYLWNFLAKKRISSYANEDKLLKASLSSNECSKNFFTLPGLSDKRKEFIGKKIVGFSMEQMYNVVSDVENYNRFVPFCTKSLVHTRNKDELSGELEIGFPPVIESYTSRVTLKRPHLVKAVCTEGRLFDHLVTIWRFSPGLKQQPQSCIIDFYVSFEFKSTLHSQLAHMFFNELVRQMEGAFFKEAEKRFGTPTMSVIKLKES